MLHFIIGSIGSGKTFLLKLLVEHFQRCYSRIADGLMTLTGVASLQILGKTLHSVLLLNIEKCHTVKFQRMSGDILQQERQKMRHIIWLLIDEISLVSYKNLKIINLRLQEFKNNKKLFGGVNVFFVGDIMQLSLVKGHYLGAQFKLVCGSNFCFSS